MKARTIVEAVVAAVAVMTAGQVAASGFQLLEQNASGLGNAYAGSAVVGENASTIFFNPAAMTKLQPREVSLGLNVVSPSYKFKDEGSSNAPAATGGNGGDAGSVAAVPNAYLSWALNKDLYLGVGLSAPFGLMTKYEDDWVGRFQSQKFDVKTMNLNPSIAYRLNDKVSLGFGLNYQHMEATYQRRLSAGSAALPAPTNAALQNTTAELKADANSWGWNAGTTFSLSDSMQMGLSYRSRVKHKLQGDLTASGPAGTTRSDASADITLPDTFILSLTQNLGERWEMLGDLSRTRWSSIRHVDIVSGGTAVQTLEANFRDTWRVALGANYRYSDTWKIKYGIAYDQSPVRSAQERLVSLPDNDRIWFSLGAQYKPAKTAALDVGVSYLFIRDTRIDNNQASANPQQNRGRVTGTYEGNVAILGLQYSQSF